MFEQSKSTRRRFYDGNFHNRYFNGNGIDIGGKPDPFSQYIGVFPLVKSVKIWDLEDGDAQYMNSAKDESYDFVISSHCLEHMVDVYEAFNNWIRITKKGGYLIITVPDEDMYEQENWPSLYNEDHKWTFTINKNKSWSQNSINIFDLLRHFSDLIEIEKVEKISDFYNYNLENIDQTLQPNVESSIEFIIKKKSLTNVIPIQKNRYHLETEKIQSFQQQFGSLISKVDQLDLENTKYLIYGYGTFARLLEKLIPDNIITFIDKSSTLIDDKIEKNQIYSINSIPNIEFDYILISVLGREKKIKNDLTNIFNIPDNKIISF